MSQHNTPDWMQEENEAAAQQAEKGDVANPHAPRLVAAEQLKTRVKPKQKPIPRRQQKLFQIQPGHLMAFERLAVELKHSKGKKSPDLIEEALELLFKKHKFDFNKT